MSLQGPKTVALDLEPAAPLALGGALASSYAYCAGGDLAAATTNGVAASYTFDELGNLVAERVAGAGETRYAYDEASRLQSTRFTPEDPDAATLTTFYGWDAANAFRTSQGPQADPAQRPVQMTYTALGRMSAYANADTNTSATYTYDAAGQRTRKTVTAGGVTTTTTYAYEGLTLLFLSAVQGATSWRLDYLTDEEGVPWGGVYRSPASSTSPVYFTIITTDRGDVVELLDADGAAFCAYRYDPWGLPQGAGSHATGVWTQATSLVTSSLAAQIASRQVLRYAGYVYDAESGLYYCSARYYDPATRQWTSADPAKADGEGSAFQYCGGDPVGMVDPTGLRKWRCADSSWHFHSDGRNAIRMRLTVGWYTNGKRVWSVSSTLRVWGSEYYTDRSTRLHQWNEATNYRSSRSGYYTWGGFYRFCSVTLFHGRVRAWQGSAPSSRGYGEFACYRGEVGVRVWPTTVWTGHPQSGGSSRSDHYLSCSTFKYQYGTLGYQPAKYLYPHGGLW